MAPTIIKAVRHLHISPLVDIRHSAFAQAYEHGLATRLFGTQKGDGPVKDTYFVNLFLDGLRQGHFQYKGDLRSSLDVGFRLGVVHGGVLFPDGTRRPDVTTLLTLHDHEVKRGYAAGREYFFTETDDAQAWRWTEEHVLERLRELAEEYGTYQDAERTIRFSIGALLGELSGRLFPWTPEEHRAVEEESIRVLGYVCAINPKSIAARQFYVQAVS